MRTSLMFTVYRPISKELKLEQTPFSSETNDYYFLRNSLQRLW